MTVNKIICDIITQAYGLHGNYIFDYAYSEYLHQRTLMLGMPVIGVFPSLNLYMNYTVENKLDNAYCSYAKAMILNSSDTTSVVEHEQDVDNYLKRRLLNAKR